ncbi:MAG TPA: hypothetical protein VFV67_16940 [Actinophytocola sp.]|uniref:hypothetical protein n=1 Tax=Actinophytocola sp. TaxID=1872138 RepID=UPI002DB74078|nr:hypothetical protein [Actinophytocola sp.]HEU5472340.1 hypothetical protein [Actinophytocola sp.]
MDRVFRRTALAGLIVFGGLQFGALPAIAAPPAPVGPTEIAVPTVPPLPPKPPCKTVLKCQPPTLEPCFTTRTEDCRPKTSTTEPTPPTNEPSEPATPAQPPAGIPTPNRIDTGGDPGGGAATEPVAATVAQPDPSWLLLAVPAGALVLFIAGLCGAWIARSERERRP